MFCLEGEQGVGQRGRPCSRKQEEGSEQFWSEWVRGRNHGTPTGGLKTALAPREDFPVAHKVKDLPTMQESWVRSLGQEDALEKGMATHSSILAW